MPVERPLPKKHPLLNAWSQYQRTESFGNTRKWLDHPEHRQGSLWAIFMAGYCAGMAQSTGYVADAEIAPQSVTFNNGRVVTLYMDSDGKSYLEIEGVSTDETGFKIMEE